MSCLFYIEITQLFEMNADSQSDSGTETTGEKHMTCIGFKKVLEVIQNTKMSGYDFGMTRDQATQLLENEHKCWQDESTIVLSEKAEKLCAIINAQPFAVKSDNTQAIVDRINLLSELATTYTYELDGFEKSIAEITKYWDNHYELNFFLTCTIKRCGGGMGFL